MPHAYDNSDLQGDEEVRCIGCCTGCALPGHRCCDVQARLDGLHQAVYEERDRLLDAINEAEAHARARMLQLRGRVMNNDFDIDALQVPARKESTFFCVLCSTICGRLCCPPGW